MHFQHDVAKISSLPFLPSVMQAGFREVPRLRTEHWRLYQVVLSEVSFFLQAVR